MPRRSEIFSRRTIEGRTAAVVGLVGVFLTSGLLAQNMKSHTVESPFQPGPQEIKVLLPDGYDERKSYRVLYLLPVGAGPGSALRVFQNLDIPNRHGLIVAEMTFALTPWYGDHPTDPQIRQESYLRDFVVPFMETHYAAMRSPEGRLLFGFSKSGWGAFTLILRNPEVFGYAASWDAPYFLTDFHYGMDRIFGTEEQLKEYRPDLLAVRQKRHFQNRTRLVLGGENKWGMLIPTPAGGSHTKEMHELLVANSILHVYRPDLNAIHSWKEEWIGPMVVELMALAESTREPLISKPSGKAPVSSPGGTF